MKAFICKCCGATGLKVQNGYFVCEYCDTKFLATEEDYAAQSRHKNLTASPLSKQSGASVIALGSDVEMLLQKCRENPRNARKYANLILDIDPTNKEAQKYL